MTMQKIIFASNNAGKIAEVSALLAPLGYETIALPDLHETADIPETGTDFASNAFIKANYVAKKYHLPCFADDSGLEVEALQGLPGVHSKRFSPEGTDEANNRLLLKVMGNIKDRKARFTSVICYVTPYGAQYFEGIVEGEIALTPVYGNGFGYDPLFFVTETQSMMSELTLSEKNRVSHRARSMQKFIRFLQEESHETSRI